MDNAGLLQEGANPNSEQYAKYMPRLNDLVNVWQTEGIKLWTLAMLQVTLVAGQGTYVLPAGSVDSVVTSKPLEVLEGYFADQNSIWRPLDKLSWNTYDNLSNPTQQGAVTGFFANKQQTQMQVTTWLVPDATAALGTLQLLIQQQITNVVSTIDTINFPREWFMALHWGLADEICTGQPDAIVQRCQQRAMMYKDKLEEWDQEVVSVFFQPNSQAGHSRF
jgi:hypothetical protein